MLTRPAAEVLGKGRERFEVVVKQGNIREFFQEEFNSESSSNGNGSSSSSNDHDQNSGKLASFADKA